MIAWDGCTSETLSICSLLAALFSIPHGSIAVDHALRQGQAARAWCQEVIRKPQERQRHPFSLT